MVLAHYRDSVFGCVTLDELSKEFGAFIYIFLCVQQGTRQSGLDLEWLVEDSI